MRSALRAVGSHPRTLASFVDEIKTLYLLLMTQEKLCKRCGQPVTANAEHYEVFEQMHWLCFHLEYEHEGDPDKACRDPSCPWWHIEVLKQTLVRLGHDPDAIIGEAIAKRTN